YEGLREHLGIPELVSVIAPSAKVNGGVVPLINPVIQPWLSLYPNPNLPGNQYTYNFNQPTTENYGQMRVDQNLSTNDSLFGRYTTDKNLLNKPQLYQGFSTIAKNRYQYATISANHTFSPSVLNTARFSYSRTIERYDPNVNLVGPQFSFVPGLGMG